MIVFSVFFLMTHASFLLVAAQAPCYRYTQCMGKIRSRRENSVLVERVIWRDKCVKYRKNWDTDAVRKLFFCFKSASFCPLFPGYEKLHYHDPNKSAPGRVTVLINHPVSQHLTLYFLFFAAPARAATWVSHFTSSLPLILIFSLCRPHVFWPDRCWRAHQD